MKSVYYKWYGDTKKFCWWIQICVNHWKWVNKWLFRLQGHRLVKSIKKKKCLLSLISSFVHRCMLRNKTQNDCSPNDQSPVCGSSYIITAKASQVWAGDKLIHSQWLQETKGFYKPWTKAPPIFTRCLSNEKVHIWWSNFKMSPASSYRKHALYKIKV